MTEKNVPSRLWCFGIEYLAKLRQLIPRGVDGRIGCEMVTGKTPDISEYLDFEFYDLVWYHTDERTTGREPIRALARWVGVSHRVGSDMCYWLIPVSGRAISETTVQHVTQDDMNKPGIHEQVKEFNDKLRERLNDTNFIIRDSENDFYFQDVYDFSKDDPDAYGDGSMTPVEYVKDENGNVIYDPVRGGDGIIIWDEYGKPKDYEPRIKKEEPTIEPYDNPSLFDKYIGAEIILDKDNGQNIATRRKATVITRAVDDDGKPIGKANDNPLLDTRAYDVQLEDGTMDRYYANIIADNLWSQCDGEGRQFHIAHEIIDHRKNRRALTADDAYVIGSYGSHKPKKTTVGWEILVKWADGSTNWVPLKDVKESNPVEMAEYTVANKIAEEPAFAWWVPLTHRQRNRVINKVKKKYWRTTHKFGIELPHSVEEALKLDKKNKNTLWADAIKKEMDKAQVAYVGMKDLDPEKARKGQEPTLVGFQEI